jgi:DNA (cytosine-5)-methyltransferase 1
VKGLIIDLFAGGGGASVGIEAATKRPVDIAINHSPVAMEVHAANHPRTLHLEADVWEVQPKLAVGKRRVSLLWLSPDCCHHSVAKGGKPLDQGLRSLAWVGVRWAREVRPDVIGLENVPEFESWGPLDSDGHPIKARKGETFRRWKRELEKLGYRVEHRVLDASHFGAPTKRRRLFLVARCDGQPICWPAPTHGPGLLPLHTAAECIDWSLPCPSIFERKKPLAEKTLWRIAQGIKRFVLENPRPFIVKVNHGRHEDRSESLDQPLSTVTATQRGHALVAPTLIQTSYGEREGQRPRYLDLHQPLGTVVAQGGKHALVTAFLAKHFGQRHAGEVQGSELGAPIGTITAKDHHGLAAVTLLKLRGQCHGADVSAPMPTVTANGFHIAEVRAFLTAFYGSDGGEGKGQDLFAPMRTLTAKARLGLVTVEGIEHQIADIGLRMLRPLPELIRAQFGRFADSYDLTAAKTQEEQTRLIGNSVPPEVVEALVRANLPDAQREAA